MNVEHLIEPKLKELENQIKDFLDLHQIQETLNRMDWDFQRGYPEAMTHQSGSMIIQRRSGPYVVHFQIEKL
jgi:hypothetical protein